MLKFSEDLPDERTVSAQMRQFAEVFPDERIVVSLIRQLSWTHIIALIPLEKPLQRDFYAEMCRIERWSVRTLRQKIGSMLYERTALSKKPEELARIELDALRDEDKLTPDLVFRDPYFLDFLGLTGTFQEKNLEAAILREMEAFILEIGVGFSFIARQRQKERFEGKSIHCNAQMNTRLIKKFCAIDAESHKLLEVAVNKLGLSARAYSRILKIARTIADIEGEASVKSAHISEAIQYRSLDRRAI